MDHTGLTHAADRLDHGATRGGFVPRAALDERDPRGLTAAAVLAAKRGDSDALRYLYLRYADNVFGYVRSIVRDDYDAEDVTQQVFAKLIVVIGRYEQRSMPFSAWILRVAHNAAIDHVRTRRPVPCEEVHPRDIEEDASGRERFADLRLALAALPPEQRNVIMLRFLVGLSPREIAERLGRSEDAVHGLQHRGRRRLRVELARIQEEPAALPLAA
jgi:RNA polymerase sigma-70 factor (ECF subfamily)